MLTGSGCALDTVAEDAHQEQRNRRVMGPKGLSDPGHFVCLNRLPKPLKREASLGSPSALGFKENRRTPQRQLLLRMLIGLGPHILRLVAEVAPSSFRA